MKVTLSPIEIRVLGALVEKELTTPENYPLTLNALTGACNQKTNREPVMALTDNTVLDAVESLIQKTLVGQRSGAGSRVPKYAHRLHHRLTDEYEFATPERAVLSVLMLRGPQTAAEIRTRAVRLYEFADMPALENTLAGLGEREDGPFIVRLARQPGRKEARYAQLWGGDIDPDAVSEPGDAAVSDDSARVSELEHRVQALSQEVAELRRRLDDFVRQFE